MQKPEPAYPAWQWQMGSKFQLLGQNPSMGVGRRWPSESFPSPFVLRLAHVWQAPVGFISDIRDLVFGLCFNCISGGIERYADLLLAFDSLDFVLGVCCALGSGMIFFDFEVFFLLRVCSHKFLKFPGWEREGESKNVTYHRSTQGFLCSWLRDVEGHNAPRRKGAKGERKNLKLIRRITRKKL